MFHYYSILSLYTDASSICIENMYSAPPPSVNVRYERELMGVGGETGEIGFHSPVGRSSLSALQ